MKKFKLDDLCRLIGGEEFLRECKGLNGLAINREGRTEYLRRKIQKKLRSKKKTHPPNPPPRYDDAYFEGLEWLDSLAFSDRDGPSIFDIDVKLDEEQVAKWEKAYQRNKVREFRKKIHDEIFEFIIKGEIVSAEDSLRVPFGGSEHAAWVSARFKSNVS